MCYILLARCKRFDIKSSRRKILSEKIPKCHVHVESLKLRLHYGLDNSKYPQRIEMGPEEKLCVPTFTYI